MSSENRSSFEESVERVFDRLMSMPASEFEEALQEHETGDIAELLVHSRAFEVGELEAEAYADPVTVTVVTAGAGTVSGWSRPDFATWSFTSSVDAGSLYLPNDTNFLGGIDFSQEASLSFETVRISYTGATVTWTGEKRSNILRYPLQKKEPEMALAA
jgi:hypothetical protein